MMPKKRSMELEHAQEIRDKLDESASPSSSRRGPRRPRTVRRILKRNPDQVRMTWSKMAAL